MCQLNPVVFRIFATFDMSFHLVLSVEHEPELAEPTAQQQFFCVISNQNVPLSVNKNSVFFRLSNSCHTVKNRYPYC